MPTFNNANKLPDLASDYFVRMMLPASEKKAEGYVREERKEIITILDSNNYSDYNFVVVGSGTLWYVDEVYEKIKKYVAIEPLADIFIHKQVLFLIKKLDKIAVIGKEFGQFKKKELGDGNSIFLFHFNILSYIPDPINKINKYLKEGDILYISSWSDTATAKKLRKEYFDFINIGYSHESSTIDPESRVGLCDLDMFKFADLSFYKRHERIKGKVTDVLIIYT